MSRLTQSLGWNLNEPVRPVGLRADGAGPALVDGGLLIMSLSIDRDEEIEAVRLSHVAWTR